MREAAAKPVEWSKGASPCTSVLLCWGTVLQASASCVLWQHRPPSSAVWGREGA